MRQDGASGHQARPLDYDAEVRRHDDVLRRAWGVQPHEHVVDIGCGLGQTTCEAARMAYAGSALGVDISASAVERARELARAQGRGNVAFELTVVPSGDVLPCPTAHALPLPHVSVRQHPLAWIWERSPLFQRFRGTGWMPDPCRSCERREVDFGGCRCQAFQLTGDAARTDPVCHLSPDHGLVAAAVQAANHGPGPAGAPLTFRPQPGRPRKS